MFNLAQHTVVLKSLLENTESKTAIEKALSSYPLYAGKKKYDMIPTREELNKRLLNHYKYREIAFETVGRFVDELEIVMCDIMPHYNELFKTVEIMADLESPFDNVDVIETFNEEKTDVTNVEGSATNSQTETSTSSGTATTEGNSTTTNENNVEGNTANENTVESGVTSNKSRKVSDTPQNVVNGIDNYLTEHVVENEANDTITSETGTGTTSTKEEGTTTNISNDTTTSSSEGSGTTTGTSSNTGKSEGTTTTSHTYTKKGNQGVNTYAHDMNEFRTSIIDVVNQIINDERVNELFMLVW